MAFWLEYSEAFLASALFTGQIFISNLCLFSNIKQCTQLYTNTNSRSNKFCDHLITLICIFTYKRKPETALKSY